MIEALLIDIDGTLVERGGAVPGAPEAVAALRASGLRLRFLTNIGSRPPRVLAEELGALGFGIAAHELRTAATAAVEVLATEGASYTDLLLPPGVAPLFEGLTIDRAAPDYVVLGDLGPGFTYDRLNAAFALLRSGARLLALHRNPYWLGPDGPMLDSGAFVSGLETATGKPALVCGKPSGIFFSGALDEIGTTAARTLVVGDDQTTDVVGAHAIGAASVMVRTGKGEHTDPALPSPHHVINSIAELPALVATLGATARAVAG